jgi:hypothetical protein
MACRDGGAPIVHQPISEVKAGRPAPRGARWKEGHMGSDKRQHLARRGHDGGLTGRLSSISGASLGLEVVFGWLKSCVTHFLLFFACKSRT